VTDKNFSGINISSVFTDNPPPDAGALTVSCQASLPVTIKASGLPLAPPHHFTVTAVGKWL